MKSLSWYIENLAGIAILFGIVLLLLSPFFEILSSFGWILIIYGVIWAVLDMTLFEKIKIW